MRKRYLKKIIAQNPDDIKIISALCSEAEVAIKNIKFLKKNKIFIFPLMRIDKEISNNKKFISSILKFEYIDVSKSKNIYKDNKNSILKLQIIDVFKRENYIDFLLIFENNKSIILSAETTEVILEDLKEVND